MPDELVSRYNANDTVATAQLYWKLKQELKAVRNDTFWRDRYWPMLPVIMRMQARGIGELDKPARDKMRSSVRKELRETEDLVWAKVPSEGYVEDTFFNSPKQKAKFLYDELKLPCMPRKNDKGEPTRSADQDALVWSLGKLKPGDDRIPLLHDFLHRTRLNTILTKYLSIQGDPDGRVRPTIKLGGTETLRLAYAGGPGEAIQQWAPECRNIVRARSGYVFVARDYSQIEARLLAYFSRDLRSIATFEGGGDVHTDNARDLFGIATEAEWLAIDPKLRVALRNYAKVFLYGLSYGADPIHLKTKIFCPCYRCVDKAPPVVNLTKPEIKKAATRWEALHQPVFTYRNDLVESIKGPRGDSSYTSPWGFRRFFFEPKEAAKRSIYNFPMQHGASQIINDDMLELDKLASPLTLQMHDELVLEVPAAEADAWDEQLTAIMERPVPQMGGVVFPTSGHRGETWGDLK